MARAGTAPIDRKRVMPKYFTVEEANRTLPLVRRVTEDIVTAYGELADRVDELRDARDRGEETRDVEVAVNELTRRINEYVAELNEIGALFKGAEPGLVDFYATLDGRPIFLCWKQGEEQIEWYHELEAGYAGRQRLPAHLLSVGGSE